MSLSRDNKKTQEGHQRACYRTPYIGSGPAHSVADDAYVRRLMGPKPVASEDQIGFSPDDWN